MATKKIMSLLLCAVMLAASLTACHRSNTEPTAAPSSGETVSASTPYEDIFVDDDDRSDIPEVKEHVMLKEVPSSFSLIGTKHLPPIDNQGGLGTCASQAITYTQFTNAVSRYLHSIDEDIEWNPSSGDDRYIFAPKFTYNFSGSGTAWVYDILVDHGAALLKDCKFYQTSSGYKTGDSLNNRQPQTVSWQVGENELRDALQYRINHYDQIWMNTMNYNFTGSDAGKELLFRIKDALVQGNVVVTGGFAYSWQYTNLSAENARTSDLAKSGDRVAVWCNGTSGGHQVSVVGYDDNLECTFNGVTMKGALLVANSWGTSWGNDGYFWVMYDAVNEISEFPELNELQNRKPALDQFCFIYWETDVEVGFPEAYVTVELSVANREGFYMEITRTDATDTSFTRVPALFDYGLNFKAIHGNYDYLASNENYMTFSGVADGEAEIGYITIGYNNLCPEGKTFDDYMWGVNIVSTYANVEIRKISLYDGSGTLRSEIVPSDSMKNVKTGTNSRFVFDTGTELSKYHYVGSYKLKNAASGLYCVPNILLLESGDSVLDAVTVDVDFDLVKRTHRLVYHNKIYILDISGKKVEDGVAVKFNAENFTKNTQDWKVVQLEDGTFNIRLACDTRYAMGMIDGKIVLVSGKDIRDYGAWYLENAGSEDMTVTVRYNDDGKLILDGRVPSECEENTLKVIVYTDTGKEVQNFTVTGEGEVREFTKEISGLSAGRYVFAVTNSSGIPVTASYVMTVK